MRDFLTVELIALTLPLLEPSGLMKLFAHLDLPDHAQRCILGKVALGSVHLEDPVKALNSLIGVEINWHILALQPHRTKGHLHLKYFVESNRFPTYSPSRMGTMVIGYKPQHCEARESPR